MNKSIMEMHEKIRTVYAITGFVVICLGIIYIAYTLIALQVSCYRIIMAL